MRRLAPVLLAMVVATGCYGVANPPPILVQNEASQSVTVTVRHPGAFLPGLIGPADYRHVVPPWQPGWCADVGISMDLGSQATITGPGVTTWTSPVMTAATLDTETYLLVRPDGTVVVVPRPQETYPCDMYPEGTPPFPSPPG